jgi:hypothetical protein
MKAKLQTDLKVVATTTQLFHLVSFLQQLTHLAVYLKDFIGVASFFKIIDPSLQLCVRTLCVQTVGDLPVPNLLYQDILPGLCICTSSAGGHFTMVISSM